MKLRTLGIVTLILLVVGVLWTLRSRGSQPGPIAPTPTPTVEKHVDEPLASTAAANPVRESAQPAPAPVVAPIAEAHTSADFALIKVLVLDKTTRAPMPDIEVSSTYDTGERSHRLEPTNGSHGKPFEVLHSDSAGRVEIEMPPNVGAQVHAYGSTGNVGSGYADIPMLQPGAVHEVVLELPTGDDMPFWMKFVDETSRAPIAGVQVARGTAKLTSDANGLAFLQGRTWSPGILRVEGDGYSRAYFKPEPGHADSSSALVVVLPKCASVNVHVVDASGQTIAGAKVDLETQGYNLGVNGGTSSMDIISLEDPHWRGVTDAAGRATIACIPPHIAIRAGITSPKRWNAPDKLVLEPGETRELEWKLTDGCELHGIVLDRSNAPVTQRDMWLRKAERKMPAYFNTYSSGETRTAKTDEQGRFRFDRVGTGTWWVGPSAAGGLDKIAPNDVAAVAQVVDVAEGQSDLDVTIRVDRGLFIRGRIVDSKGQPTKGGYVSGYDKTNKLYATLNLQSQDGTFELGPLMAGHYGLTAHGYGGEADSDVVEVDAGASDVVLRLRAGSALSGKVTSPSGEPVLGKIWLKMRDSERVSGVDCHNDGLFHIDGLEAGTYDLAAHTSDGSTGLLESVTVQGGESKTGLEIHLLPGGHVRVRHEGPDNFVNVTVLAHGVTIDLDGLERSTAREFGSPAGTVTVRASYYETDKRTVDRTVEVKAGQTVDVVFEKDAH